MAMMDYGAVVKKNGKIISDPKGGLFQNLTSLRYEPHVKGEDSEGNDIYADDHVDETIVKYTNRDGEIKEYSMAANEMAVVGDRHFMIGFYKQWFDIAIDGQIIDRDGPALYDWFSEHKKPLVFTVDDIEFKVRTICPDHDWMSILIMNFEYNGDHYEVMFGYGVDPDTRFVFGKSNYYGPARTYDWDKMRFYGKPRWKKEKKQIWKRMIAWFKEGDVTHV